jgi:hypothetical protein
MIASPLVSLSVNRQSPAIIFSRGHHQDCRVFTASSAWNESCGFHSFPFSCIRLPALGQFPRLCLSW